MTWNYAYTPYIWPSLLTVLLLVALAVYSTRRRSEPGALPFAFGCLFAALWAAGSVMEYAAVDVARKIFWAKFEATCQLPIVIAVTCFILEYTWPGRWLTRRNLALLSIAPLLSLALILTNDLHHLAWRSFGFDGSVLPRLGPGGWIIVASAYGLASVNIIVFVWLFLRSPPHRWPVAVMLTGLVGGRTIYLLEKAYILHADLPLDVLGMALEFLMYAIALFGFRILDPIPLARKTAIEQLRAGTLVLDPQGRVASLNPAAEQILGAPAGRLRGRPIRELLPAYSDGPLADPGGTEIELSLGTGQEARHYALTISLLNDWRGLEAGRLLLLRDVTEQKQAQAQIIEQQRALATLNERERMARELHDSLGQVLGYAGFQVEAAAKLARDGQGAVAATQLDRLASVIRDAHADVREYILNLRTAPSLQQPFFAVLQQYLEGFTNNYGIQTHLTIGPGLGEEPFGPDVQLQVFRILQEALSNTRKHSQARNVQIAFAAGGGRVCMTIQDDGSGFAPEDGVMTGSQHFGLQFMQERAGQLGGSLQVQSAPGAGTRVVLEVPVDGADDA